MKPVVEQKPASAPGKKSVADVTKDCQKLSGLFEFYFHPEKGKLYLLVKKAQMAEEFIYFPQTIDGVVQAGFMRGQYGSEAVIRWRKVYERLEVVKQPTAFYFDPQSPLARASSANTSNAVLASETILAEDGTGYLIDAGALFLRENLLHVQRGGDTSRSVLGRLSEAKTHITRVKTYANNASVDVAFVYENPAPAWSAGHHKADEIVDARYVTIQVRHALVRMPEGDFKPRRDDPRVGFFATQVTDMTSTEITPYRDVIHRWRLDKKKPGTVLSEPAEPITFWIENTTPVEFRDTIRSAALTWNAAYEATGFKDALVIKQQPDDAKWDAGDIDYNVLRWTSSPNPPFGGYGPSFVNPRTGEILGADVMLEFSYMTSRLRTNRLFDEVGLAGLPAFGAEEQGQLGMVQGHSSQCLAGLCTHQGRLFGGVVLRAAAGGRVEMDRLTKEALHYLVLHEVGHTLGLNHNFRGSQLHDAVKVHDAEVTGKAGLMGSVMDYPSANLAPPGVKQGQYYVTKPGPYDHWAIEYGYSEALEDPVAEEQRLEAIAARSHQAELGFANDADDMRSVGKGIDPRAMLFEMSSDPVVYGTGRCELVEERIKGLLARGLAEGESWQQLVQDYAMLTSEKSNALVAVSRYVGGVKVERVHVGQVAEVRPFTPVEKVVQLAALKMLGEHAFAPQAWQVPAELAAHLQVQRRGFDHHEGEDPRFHERIAKIQRSLLDHLLHSAVLTRLADSQLYGNELSVAEMLKTLTAAIFYGDENGRPNTQRQTLQAMYLERLLSIANNGQMVSASQAAALYEVITLQRVLDAGALFAGAPEHAELMRYKIRRGMDEASR